MNVIMTSRERELPSPIETSSMKPLPPSKTNTSLSAK